MLVPVCMRSVEGVELVDCSVLTVELDFFLWKQVGQAVRKTALRRGTKYI